MLKKLRKVNTKCWHYDDDGNYVEGIHAGIRGDVSGIRGDVNEIWGDVSWLSGDVSGISGNVSGIWGDVSGLVGNVSGIVGDVNDCAISPQERVQGVNIADLIATALVDAHQG